MDMEAFVDEATSAGAVVWLSLQGGAAIGQLQQWLEDYRVPFVGALSRGFWVFGALEG